MTTSHDDTRHAHSGAADGSPAELKRDLLRRLLAQEFVDLSRIPVTARKPGSPPPPLSYAQEELWLFDQLHPGSTAFNVVFPPMRFEGRLDTAALKRALDEIVRRHESLRTRFSAQTAQPVQIIDDARDVALPIVDLEDRLPAEREAEIQRCFVEELDTPFDLVGGPLLRARLLRLGPTTHVLQLAVHHIIFDGASLSVFSSELAALYGAYSSGQPSPLSPLPVQYGDFAVWQRRWVQSDKLREQTAYWRQQLAGASELYLPVDRARAPESQNLAYRETLSLSRGVSNDLRSLCRGEGVTPFIGLLAAYASLLHRYSHQDDVVVGSPVTIRNRPELGDVFGLLVNLIVMRCDFSGEPTFRDVLARVREVVSQGLRNSHAPFSRVAREMGFRQGGQRNPFIRAAFNYDRAQAGVFQCPGLSASFTQVSQAVARFDLEVHVHDLPEGLGIELLGAAEWFDRSTLRRMLGHFATLLSAMVRHPEIRISECSLLTDAERQQLLVAWNATEVPYSPDATVVERFGLHASRSPGSEAVSFGARRMTYGELDEASGRLASWLRGQGVRTNVPVGILLERSLEMVVSWLGVLKAAGAYVPLDPEYPKERLAFMLENAGAPVLLTQASLAARAEGYGGRVLCLDEDWEAREMVMAASDNGERPGAESLAYIIYTSGSTGRPKGVAVPHAGLANLVNWHNRVYGVTPADRATQIAGLGFDACVWEVWPYLAAGASVHLVEPDVRESPERLWRWLCERAVTLSFVPTPLAEALLRLPRPEGLALRALFTGGDRLHGVLSESLPFRLVNHYGPTENSVVATAVDVEPGDSLPPIGRPIDNVRAYVLDARGQLVPIGVPGELYLSGKSLARGYWGRPDLTAERFVEIKPGEGISEYAYRTGDRVCWRADGTLKFFGRTDEQVKIRGHRIELGEIEAALTEQVGIREAVVLCREDAPGDKRLVAYLTTQGKTPVEPSELRAYLREKLPTYMVPAAFLFLDQLPLTPNGKVDRASLPAPQSAHQAASAFVAPREDWEARIAGIWREVLQVEQVGVHDNFFDLGGDSIISIQVVSRLQEAGLALSTRDVFQHPTVAELAQTAKATVLRQRESDVPTGDLEPAPVQHWFLEQALVGADHFNQSVVLRTRCAIDEERLKEAIASVLDHHDALRLRVAGAARPRLYVAPSETPLPFVRIDLADVEDAVLPGVIEERATEIQSSLKLTEGPLLRVGYFDLGSDRPALLLITIHHMAVDGVSWRILLEDLDAAYEQRIAGRPVTLPPKTTSYRRWAHKLADLAGSRALDADREYWLTELENPVAPLPVDDDRPRAESTHGNMGIVSVELDEMCTSDLLRAAHRAYKTQVNDLLLAALCTAFAGWSGASELTVDLEAHGREVLFDDADVSRTVGWFTSIFPVTLNPGVEKEASSAIRRIKESLRRVPRRGVSFGILRYLSPDASLRERLRERPDPEVSFNYLGQFDNMLAGSRRFELANMSAGRSHAPTIVRRHLIDVVAAVRGGRLCVKWAYCTRSFRRQTIEALAQRYVTSLVDLVKHCVSRAEGSYTPSDFPHANLDQSKLDALMARIRQGQGGSG